MLSTVYILVAVSRVRASWLRWSGNKEPVWVPHETKYIGTEDGGVGRTPQPTPAPGVKSEGEHVLDLLRRATSTEWVNSKTCGWVSGISSYSWSCTGNSTCATNIDNVVACASGTYSPFYSVCFDLAASQQGRCNSIGSATGCCQSSQYPACGTYIWTGSPTRSMYRCFTETTIISMLDEPQFVIDASLSSKTASTSTSTRKTASTDGAVTATSDSTTAAPESESGGTSTSTSSSSSSTTKNTGAIAGGVVGGVGFLAILAGLIAFFLLRSKKKKREKKRYNAVPVNEQYAPPPAPPPQTGMGNPAVSHMGGAGAMTIPPKSPSARTQQPNQDPRLSSVVKSYDPNTAQQRHDPNQGYYNQQSASQPSPSNPDSLHPGAPSTMTGSSLLHSPRQPGYHCPQMTGSMTGAASSSSYNPQQSMDPASELDDGPARAPPGHYQNTVEMASKPQRY